MPSLIRRGDPPSAEGIGGDARWRTPCAGSRTTASRVPESVSRHHRGRIDRLPGVAQTDPPARGGHRSAVHGRPSLGHPRGRRRLGSRLETLHELGFVFPTAREPELAYCSSTALTQEVVLRRSARAPPSRVSRRHRRPSRRCILGRARRGRRGAGVSLWPQCRGREGGRLFDFRAGEIGTRAAGGRRGAGCTSRPR